jgi:hypothetical protein
LCHFTDDSPKQPAKQIDKSLGKSGDGAAARESSCSSCRGQRSTVAAQGCVGGYAGKPCETERCGTDALGSEIEPFNASNPHFHKQYGSLPLRPEGDGPRSSGVAAFKPSRTALTAALVVVITLGSANSLLYKIMCVACSGLCIWIGWIDCLLD